MVYRSDEEHAYPSFSMRRYRGTAFGLDGRLPDRYEVTVSVQPFSSPSFQPPVGENGVLVYYLDPTHYVELNIQHQSVSIWSADSARPSGSSGWKHYDAWYGATTNAGDVRHLRARLDLHAHTIQYWVDGHSAFTRTVPMLTVRPHGVALRWVGNAIQFGDLSIPESPEEGRS